MALKCKYIYIYILNTYYIYIYIYIYIYEIYKIATIKLYKRKLYVSRLINFLELSIVT